MLSKKEIIRAYNKLIKEVETDDFYKIDLSNRVNCYICSCGHITKTKDVDSGVTPFMHNCEKCKKMANSSLYRDIAPDQDPTKEWYRPTLEQVLKIKDENLLDHILRGGLDSRKISNDENSEGNKKS
jgi:hypothetical protein